MLYANGSLKSSPSVNVNIVANNVSQISEAFTVPSCAAHRISVSAVNNCGEGQRSPERTLDIEDIIILPRSMCGVVAAGGTNINKSKP